MKKYLSQNLYYLNKLFTQHHNHTHNHNHTHATRITEYHATQTPVYSKITLNHLDYSHVTLDPDHFTQQIKNDIILTLLGSHKLSHISISAYNTAIHITGVFKGSIIVFFTINAITVDNDDTHTNETTTATPQDVALELRELIEVGRGVGLLAHPTVPTDPTDPDYRPPSEINPRIEYSEDIISATQGFIDLSRLSTDGSGGSGGGGSGTVVTSDGFPAKVIDLSETVATGVNIRYEIDWALSDPDGLISLEDRGDYLIQNGSNLVVPNKSRGIEFKLVLKIGNEAGSITWGLDIVEPSVIDFSTIYVFSRAIEVSKQIEYYLPSYYNINPDYTIKFIAEYVTNRGGIRDQRVPIANFTHTDIDLSAGKYYPPDDNKPPIVLENADNGRGKLVINPEFRNTTYNIQIKAFIGDIPTNKTIDTLTITDLSSMYGGYKELDIPIAITEPSMPNVQLKDSNKITLFSNNSLEVIPLTSYFEPHPLTSNLIILDILEEDINRGTLPSSRNPPLDTEITVTNIPQTSLSLSSTNSLTFQSDFRGGVYNIQLNATIEHYRDIALSEKFTIEITEPAPVELNQSSASHAISLTNNTVYVNVSSFFKNNVISLDPTAVLRVSHGLDSILAEDPSITYSYDAVTETYTFTGEFRNFKGTDAKRVMLSAYVDRYPNQRQDFTIIVEEEPFVIQTIPKQMIYITSETTTPLQPVTISLLSYVQDSIDNGKLFGDVTFDISNIAELTQSVFIHSDSDGPSPPEMNTNETDLTFAIDMRSRDYSIHINMYDKYQRKEQGQGYMDAIEIQVTEPNVLTILPNDIQNTISNRITLSNQDIPFQLTDIFQNHHPTLTNVIYHITSNLQHDTPHVSLHRGCNVVSKELNEVTIHPDYRGAPYEITISAELPSYPENVNKPSISIYIIEDTLPQINYIGIVGDTPRYPAETVEPITCNVQDYFDISSYPYIHKLSFETSIDTTQFTEVTVDHPETKQFSILPDLRDTTYYVTLRVFDDTRDKSGLFVRDKTHVIAHVTELPPIQLNGSYIDTSNIFANDNIISIIGDINDEEDWLKAPLDNMFISNHPNTNCNIIYTPNQQEDGFLEVTEDKQFLIFKPNYRNTETPVQLEAHLEGYPHLPIIISWTLNERQDAIELPSDIIFDNIPPLSNLQREINLSTDINQKYREILGTSYDNQVINLWTTFDVVSTDDLQLLNVGTEDLLIVTGSSRSPQVSLIFNKDRQVIVVEPDLLGIDYDIQLPLTIRTNDELLTLRYTITELPPIRPRPPTTSLEDTFSNLTVDKVTIDVADYFEEFHSDRDITYKINFDDGITETIGLHTGSNMITRDRPNERFTYNADYRGTYFQVSVDAFVSGYEEQSNTKVLHFHETKLPSVDDIYSNQPVIDRLGETVDNIVYHYEDFYRLDDHPYSQYFTYNLYLPDKVTYNKDDISFTITPNRRNINYNVYLEVVDTDYLGQVVSSSCNIILYVEELSLLTGSVEFPSDVTLSNETYRLKLSDYFTFSDSSVEYRVEHSLSTNKFIGQRPYKLMDNYYTFDYTNTNATMSFPVTDSTTHLPAVNIVNIPPNVPDTLVISPEHRGETYTVSVTATVTPDDGSPSQTFTKSIEVKEEPLPDILFKTPRSELPLSISEELIVDDYKHDISTIIDLDSYPYPTHLDYTLSSIHTNVTKADDDNDIIIKPNLRGGDPYTIHVVATDRYVNMNTVECNILLITEKPPISFKDPLPQIRFNDLKNTPVTIHLSDYYSNNHPSNNFTFSLDYTSDIGNYSLLPNVTSNETLENFVFNPDYRGHSNTVVLTSAVTGYEYAEATLSITFTFDEMSIEPFFNNMFYNNLAIDKDAVTIQPIECNLDDFYDETKHPYPNVLVYSVYPEEQVALDTNNKITVTPNLRGIEYNVQIKVTDKVTTSFVDINDVMVITELPPINQIFHFVVSSADSVGGYYKFEKTAHRSDEFISAENQNPQITLFLGDEIRITNKFNDNHPLAIKDSGGNNVANANQGVTTYRFLKPGTYQYYCTSHTSMKGDINVILPGSNDGLETTHEAIAPITLSYTEQTSNAINIPINDYFIGNHPDKQLSFIYTITSNGSPTTNLRENVFYGDTTSSTLFSQTENLLVILPNYRHDTYTLEITADIEGYTGKMPLHVYVQEEGIPELSSSLVISAITLNSPDLYENTSVVSELFASYPYNTELVYDVDFSKLSIKHMGDPLGLPENAIGINRDTGAISIQPNLRGAEYTLTFSAEDVLFNNKTEDITVDVTEGYPLTVVNTSITQLSAKQHRGMTETITTDTLESIFTKHNSQCNLVIDRIILDDLIYVNTTDTTNATTPNIPDTDLSITLKLDNTLPETTNETILTMGDNINLRYMTSQLSLNSNLEQLSVIDIPSSLPTQITFTIQNTPSSNIINTYVGTGLHQLSPIQHTPPMSLHNLDIHVTTDDNYSNIRVYSKELSSGDISSILNGEDIHSKISSVDEVVTILPDNSSFEFTPNNRDTTYSIGIIAHLEGYEWYSVHNRTVVVERATIGDGNSQTFEKTIILNNIQPHTETLIDIINTSREEGEENFDESLIETFEFSSISIVDTSYESLDELGFSYTYNTNEKSITVEGALRGFEYNVSLVIVNKENTSVAYTFHITVKETPPIEVIADIVTSYGNAGGPLQPIDTIKILGPLFINNTDGDLEYNIEIKIDDTSISINNNHNTELSCVQYNNNNAGDTILFSAINNGLAFDNPITILSNTGYSLRFIQKHNNTLFSYDDDKNAIIRVSLNTQLNVENIKEFVVDDARINLSNTNTRLQQMKVDGEELYLLYADFTNNKSYLVTCTNILSRTISITNVNDSYTRPHTDFIIIGQSSSTKVFILNNDLNIFDNNNQNKLNVNAVKVIQQNGVLFFITKTSVLKMDKMIKMENSFYFNHFVTEVVSGLQLSDNTDDIHLAHVGKKIFIIDNDILYHIDAENGNVTKHKHGLNNVSGIFIDDPDNSLYIIENSGGEVNIKRYEFTNYTKVDRELTVVGNNLQSIIINPYYRGEYQVTVTAKSVTHTQYNPASITFNIYEETLTNAYNKLFGSDTDTSSTFKNSVDIAGQDETLSVSYNLQELLHVPLDTYHYVDKLTYIIEDVTEDTSSGATHFNSNQKLDYLKTILIPDTENREITLPTGYLGYDYIVDIIIRDQYFTDIKTNAKIYVKSDKLLELTGTGASITKDLPLTHVIHFEELRDYYTPQNDISTTHTYTYEIDLHIAVVKKDTDIIVNDTNGELIYNSDCNISSPILHTDYYDQQYSSHSYTMETSGTSLDIINKVVNNNEIFAINPEYRNIEYDIVWSVVYKNMDITTTAIIPSGYLYQDMVNGKIRVTESPVPTIDFIENTSIETFGDLHIVSTPDRPFTGFYDITNYPFKSYLVYEIHTPYMITTSSKLELDTNDIPTDTISIEPNLRDDNYDVYLRVFDSVDSDTTDQSNLIFKVSELPPIFLRNTNDTQYIPVTLQTIDTTQSLIKIDADINSLVSINHPYSNVEDIIVSSIKMEGVTYNGGSSSLIDDFTTNSGYNHSGGGGYFELNRLALENKFSKNISATYRAYLSGYEEHIIEGSFLFETSNNPTAGSIYNITEITLATDGHKVSYDFKNIEGFVYDLDLYPVISSNVIKIEGYDGAIRNTTKQPDFTVGLSNIDITGGLLGCSYSIEVKLGIDIENAIDVVYHVKEYSPVMKIDGFIANLGLSTSPIRPEDDTLNIAGPFFEIHVDTNIIYTITMDNSSTQEDLRYYNKHQGEYGVSYTTDASTTEQIYITDSNAITDINNLASIQIVPEYRGEYQITIEAYAEGYESQSNMITLDINEDTLENTKNRLYLNFNSSITFEGIEQSFTCNLPELFNLSLSDYQYLGSFTYTPVVTSMYETTQQKVFDIDNKLSYVSGVTVVDTNKDIHIETGYLGYTYHIDVDISDAHYTELSNNAQIVVKSDRLLDSVSDGVDMTMIGLSNHIEFVDVSEKYSVNQDDTSPSYHIQLDIQVINQGVSYYLDSDDGSIVVDEASTYGVMEIKSGLDFVADDIFVVDEYMYVVILGDPAVHKIDIRTGETIKTYVFNGSDNDSHGSRLFDRKRVIVSNNILYVTDYKGKKFFTIDLDDNTSVDYKINKRNVPSTTIEYKINEETDDVNTYIPVWIKEGDLNRLYTLIDDYNYDSRQGIYKLSKSNTKEGAYVIGTGYSQNSNARPFNNYFYFPLSFAFRGETIYVLEIDGKIKYQQGTGDSDNIHLLLEIHTNQNDNYYGDILIHGNTAYVLYHNKIYTIDLDSTNPIEVNITDQYQILKNNTIHSISIASNGSSLYVATHESNLYEIYLTHRYISPVEHVSFYTAQYPTTYTIPDSLEVANAITNNIIGIHPEFRATSYDVAWSAVYSNVTRGFVQDALSGVISVTETDYPEGAITYLDVTSNVIDDMRLDTSIESNIYDKLDYVFGTEFLELSRVVKDAEGNKITDQEILNDYLFLDGSNLSITSRGRGATFYVDVTAKDKHNESISLTQRMFEVTEELPFNLITNQYTYPDVLANTPITINLSEYVENNDKSLQIIWEFDKWNNTTSLRHSTMDTTNTLPVNVEGNNVTSNVTIYPDLRGMDIDFDINVWLEGYESRKKPLNIIYTEHAPIDKPDANTYHVHIGGDKDIFNVTENKLTQFTTTIDTEDNLFYMSNNKLVSIYKENFFKFRYKEGYLFDKEEGIVYDENEVYIQSNVTNFHGNFLLKDDGTVVSSGSLESIIIDLYNVENSSTNMQYLYVLPISESITDNCYVFYKDDIVPTNNWKLGVINNSSFEHLLNTGNDYSDDILYADYINDTYLYFVDHPYQYVYLININTKLVSTFIGKGVIAFDVISNTSYTYTVKEGEIIKQHKLYLNHQLIQNDNTTFNITSAFHKSHKDPEPYNIELNTISGDVRNPIYRYQDRRSMGCNVVDLDTYASSHDINIYHEFRGYSYDISGTVSYNGYYEQSANVVIHVEEPNISLSLEEDTIDLGILYKQVRVDDTFSQVRQNYPSEFTDLSIEFVRGTDGYHYIMPDNNILIMADEDDDNDDDDITMTFKIKDDRWNAENEDGNKIELTYTINYSINESSSIERAEDDTGLMMWDNPNYYHNVAETTDIEEEE